MSTRVTQGNTLQAGKLRHRIDLVTLTLVQDTFGGTSILDSVLFATVWARIETLTGRELVAAQQKVSAVTHKVTVRYRPGIKSKMNVSFKGRRFQIEAIENPDERTKMLFLLCIERDESALLGVT
jgi:SPP1 family predicted phage head-tail adaptor